MTELALRSSNAKTDMQAVLPPPGIDAMVQTDDLLLKDGSCQTDQPKEIDFPIQADLQSEMEAVAP